MTNKPAIGIIRVVRERFANSKAIKLDLEAQEQIMKGDLQTAERNCQRGASGRSDIVAHVLHAREVAQPTA